MASAQYGFFLGIALAVFMGIAPQPAGSIIIWGFFSVQLSWAALTCWRRTGLPFATAALVNAAVMSLCVAVLAALGHPIHDWAPESWVLFAGCAVTGWLFLSIERRVNQPKWKEWSRHMKHKTAWDIVTGRHIPQLRDDRVDARSV